MSQHVAIAGATGAVGTEFLKLLEARDFPMKSLRLLASSRSAGSKLKFRGENLEVEELTPKSFKGIDIAFFSAGGSRSKEFAPHAVDSGAVVIDNSSAFRMDEKVPLVVPEINPKQAFEHQGLIANPNCSTSQMEVALNPIHRAANIQRVVVSTYQAVSGAGASAMEELKQQLRAWANDEPMKQEVFPTQIAFNLFPHIDVFQDNGYTKEEMKMVHETRKIMNAPNMQISATCVRVANPRLVNFSKRNRGLSSRMNAKAEVTRLHGISPKPRRLTSVESEKTSPIRTVSPFGLLPTNSTRGLR